MVEIIQHSWAHEGTVEQPWKRIAVPEGSVKIIFNDPPYNIGVKYADDPTGDRRDMLAYQIWAKNTIHEQAQLLAPGGTFWWMCPESHGDFIGPLLSGLVGPRLHRVIWYETFAQYQDKRLTADYRFIFIHQKPSPCGGGLTFNGDAIRVPSDRQLKYKDKRANPKGRVPGQVWKFEDAAVQKVIDQLPLELAEQVVKALPQDPQVPGEVWKMRRLQGTADDHVDWHNAQLPPELLDRVIRGWSNEGDTVLDGFCGSGNMGLSALRNNRNFIGVDQSPTYVAKIRERLQPFIK